MAEQGADYTRGEMIIQEHERTYAGFLKMSKWGSLYIGSLVLFLALWFCTPTGFLGAFVTLVVVLAIGILVLSDKHRL